MITLYDYIFKVYELLEKLTSTGTKMDEGSFHEILSFMDENYNLFYTAFREKEIDELSRRKEE